MITQYTKDKLMHDIKRASKVIGFIKDESDHDKRQTFLALLIDELDRVADDINEIPIVQTPDTESIGTSGFYQ